MISALSVEFLPVVYANCCIGWMACALIASFQPRRLGVVQSPYARLTVALPYLAISARRASMIVGVVLSPSMRTASLAESEAGAMSGEYGDAAVCRHFQGPPVGRVSGT